MFKGIAFTGGIFGVGKSTICRHLCHELKLEYLSASKLLKWENINEDVKNKKVQDISETQSRLITGLTNTIQKEKYYLLDGHYCLLNVKNEIVNVPLETFKQINPFSLNIIIGEISEVMKQLKIRDKKLYKYEQLERLQNEELTYAKQLSKTLGVKLNIGTKNDCSELLNSLRDFLVSKS